MTYVDGRLKLLSQQRVERAKLDNEIDTENMNELSTLRNSMAVQTEDELRIIGNNLRSSLDGDGLWFFNNIFFPHCKLYLFSNGWNAHYNNLQRSLSLAQIEMCKWGHYFQRIVSWPRIRKVGQLETGLNNYWQLKTSDSWLSFSHYS